MSRTYDLEPPTQELRCVWMDAGVISYKLCDRNLECEGCPLDIALRKRQPEQKEYGEASAASDTQPAGGSPPTTQESAFQRIMDESFQSALGRPLPGDRKYHTGHTWIRQSARGTVLTGIDHLGAALLGRVPGVVLPSVGSHVQQHAAYAWVVHSDGALAIHAPIAGLVVGINSALLDKPQLIVNDPYESGWIADIVQQSEEEAGCVRSADEITPQYRAEMQSLHSQLVRMVGESPQIGATMFDGGTHLHHPSEVIGVKTFLRILGPLFRP